MSIHIRNASVVVLALHGLCAAQDTTPASAPWFADRVDGVHTSLFGTSIRHGEFVLYPFYEYARNRDGEYKPSELGFVGDDDLKGRSTAHEAILFAGYGFAEDWLFEAEAELFVDVTQEKSSADTSAMPNSFNESGLGDVESQLRWRFFHETQYAPELMTFLEIKYPLQEDKHIIGNQDWEFALGLHVTKGFDFGALSLKTSVGYDEGESEFAPGEYGIEYLKRLSDRWTLVLALEGEDDEIAGIVEAQWQLAPYATMKLNSGFGITPKAEDVAPEIGVMFSF